MRKGMALFSFKENHAGNLRIMVCDMEEIRGTNPVTGVESKERYAE